MSPVSAPETLLEDPLSPGLPAVVRSGPFLFLSSVDGVVDHRTGEIDHSVFGDGPAQAARAYGAIADRLEQCGYDGSHAVRIEHATASQDWRLERMALWPTYFGTPTQAVSQGYQGKMCGRNMITVSSIATTGEVEREIITPGPNPGRASRISRCGPLTFVIGVRGQESLSTGRVALEETPDAFADQCDIALENLQHHLVNGGSDVRDAVRFDGFLRDIGRLGELRAVVARRFEGHCDVAATYVGCPLGGATDLEISAIASSPGTPRWSASTPAGSVTRAADLVFTPGVFGDRRDDGQPDQKLFGDLHAQVDRCLAHIQTLLDLGGSSMDAIVRLDVHLSNPYQAGVVDRMLVDRFGDRAPTVTRHGTELGPTALVAVTAVGAHTATG